MVARRFVPRADDGNLVENNSELRVESECTILTTCDIQIKTINSQTKYEVTQMNDFTLSSQ